eukprot:m.18152 g.18152  ORF g.18152 m.18152 type:complete len:444 (-) comp7703_c0_seq1:449-1780(-)
MPEQQQQQQRSPSSTVTAIAAATTTSGYVHLQHPGLRTKIYTVDETSAFGHDRSFHHAAVSSPTAGRRMCVVRKVPRACRQHYLSHEAPLLRLLQHRGVPGIQRPTIAITHPVTHDIYLVYEHLSVVTDLQTHFASTVPATSESNLNVHKQSFLALCQFVKHCHTEGIAVRTLRLSSIFFTPLGEIAILSLPAACVIGDPAKSNTHTNTLLSQPTRLTLGNDIVLLGWLLGQIFTGSPPMLTVHTPNRTAMCFPIPTSLPLSFSRLLAHALSFKAIDRPTVDEILNHFWLNDLDACVPSITPQAPAPAPAPPAQQQNQQRPEHVTAQVEVIPSQAQVEAASTTMSTSESAGAIAPATRGRRIAGKKAAKCMQAEEVADADLAVPSFDCSSMSPTVSSPSVTSFHTTATLSKVAAEPAGIVHRTIARPTAKRAHPQPQSQPLVL